MHAVKKCYQLQASCFHLPSLWIHMNPCWGGFSHGTRMLAANCSSSLAANCSSSSSLILSFSWFFSATSSLPWHLRPFKGQASHTQHALRTSLCALAQLPTCPDAQHHLECSVSSVFLQFFYLQLLILSTFGSVSAFAERAHTFEKACEKRFLHEAVLGYPWQKVGVCCGRSPALCWAGLWPIETRNKLPRLACEWQQSGKQLLEPETNRASTLLHQRCSPKTSQSRSQPRAAWSQAMSCLSQQYALLSFGLLFFEQPFVICAGHPGCSAGCRLFWNAQACPVMCACFRCLPVTQSKFASKHANDLDTTHTKVVSTICVHSTRLFATPSFNHTKWCEKDAKDLFGCPRHLEVVFLQLAIERLRRAAFLLRQGTAEGLSEQVFCMAYLDLIKMVCMIHSNTVISSMFARRENPCPSTKHVHPLAPTPKSPTAIDSSTFFSLDQLRSQLSFSTSPTHYTRSHATMSLMSLSR